MENALLEPKELKKARKLESKQEKKDKKATEKNSTQNLDDGSTQKTTDDGKRFFVIRFDGDVSASSVDCLREEVTAVLEMARETDEVIACIESPGGLVHAYGLAASQLTRVRSKKVSLTVSVDKVAASGGYLMAAVADKIVAAPFALVGSIGVVAQVPNVHRLLKKNDVDVEVLTAGKHKRTLTVLGENTEEGKAKFKEELEDVHALFQEFVLGNRPDLDMEKVATGEAWYGSRAIELGLIDRLVTSDEYIRESCADGEVFEVKWKENVKQIDRILGKVSLLLERASEILRFNHR
jgi:serine protease SohB